MKIVIDSTRGRIINCPTAIAKSLYKACSYRAYNYEFMDAYLDGLWDGYVRKFSIKTHSFPAGFLVRVVGHLKKRKCKFVIDDRRKKASLDLAKIVANIDNFKFALRPYQIDGVIKGLNTPYMIFWWATSSGKTVEFSALIAALKTSRYRQTLILVSNKDLAAQHRIEIGSMLGIKVGLIEEGRFEPERVTVAVINTLFNKAVKQKKKNVIKYLENIEHLISDECHHIIDSKMFKKTINKCKGTIARHGFSGSPYSMITDDMELEAVTGPPLSKVTMSQLIRDGWVSRPEISMIKYNAQSISSSKIFATVYSNGIVKNRRRNEIIVDLIKEEFARRDDQSILVLIRIIEHGKILKDMLLEDGFESSDFEYIHGSTPPPKRMKVKEAFKENRLQLVIASQIWNEGIDIPTVNVLIKADGGGGKDVKDLKGVRSVVQQVGRVVRKPILNGDGDVDNKTENIVRIYDFIDHVHPDLMKHSMNRWSTYCLEKEFRVKEVRK